MITHTDTDPDYQEAFNDRAEYTYRYSFLPRRCYNTGRLLWLTTALRGRAMWTGPGEPVIEDRWYDSTEGLIIMLKKVNK